MSERAWTWLLLPACLGLLACVTPVGGDRTGGGGSADGGGGGCDPGLGGGPIDCGQALEVGSAQDVVQWLPTAWSEYGAYSSGPLAVTPDLVATASFTLDAAQDVPLPTNCGSYCEPTVSFHAGDSISGVQWTSSTLTVAPGARFRLRSIILDTGIGHPIPQLWILPACGEPCEPDERRCQADAVCYRADSHCRICLGDDAAVCGCFTFCGPAANGSACEYFVGGDIYTTGTCADGVCDSEYD